MLHLLRRVKCRSAVIASCPWQDHAADTSQDQLDDEDEVLLVLAEELGNFTEYVGGKQYAWTILGPLENLAAVEETLVRDKAAESISNISKDLSPQQIDEHFVPLLRRLSTGDWFTSRTSACALFAAAYPKANPEAQDEKRRLFATLVADDTPMVRRAAARALGVRPIPCVLVPPDPCESQTDVFSPSPRPSLRCPTSTPSSSPT